MQVKRAQECEANTGPAQKPLMAAAAGPGGDQAAEGAEGDADEVCFYDVLRCACSQGVLLL